MTYIVLFRTLRGALESVKEKMDKKTKSYLSFTNLTMQADQGRALNLMAWNVWGLKYPIRKKKKS